MRNLKSMWSTRMAAVFARASLSGILVGATVPATAQTNTCDPFASLASKFYVVTPFDGSTRSPRTSYISTNADDWGREDQPQFKAGCSDDLKYIRLTDGTIVRRNQTTPEVMMYTDPHPEPQGQWGKVKIYDCEGNVFGFIKGPLAGEDQTATIAGKPVATSFQGFDKAEHLLFVVLSEENSDKAITFRGVDNTILATGVLDLINDKATPPYIGREVWTIDNSSGMDPALFSTVIALRTNNYFSCSSSLPPAAGGPYIPKEVWVGVSLGAISFTALTIVAICAYRHRAKLKNMWGGFMQHRDSDIQMD